MRMRLYFFSFDIENERHTMQVVAPDAPTAFEFCCANLDGINRHEKAPIKMLRIDETLGVSLGLDQMLETAQVGFAIFVEGRGWTIDDAPVDGPPP